MAVWGDRQRRGVLWPDAAAVHAVIRESAYITPSVRIAWTCEATASARPGTVAHILVRAVCYRNTRDYFGFEV